MVEHFLRHRFILEVIHGLRNCCFSQIKIWIALRFSSHKHICTILIVPQELNYPTTINAEVTAHVSVQIQESCIYPGSIVNEKKHMCTVGQLKSLQHKYTFQGWSLQFSMHLVRWSCNLVLTTGFISPSNRFNVSWSRLVVLIFPNVVNVTTLQMTVDTMKMFVQPLAGTVYFKIMFTEWYYWLICSNDRWFFILVHRNCSEAIFTNLGCGTNFTGIFGDGCSIYRTKWVLFEWN